VLSAKATNSNQRTLTRRTFMVYVPPPPPVAYYPPQPPVVYYPQQPAYVVPRAVYYPPTYTYSPGPWGWQNRYRESERRREWRERRWHDEDDD